MDKGSNDKKTRRDETPAKAGLTTFAKPTLIILTLMAVAVGVAGLLVHRNNGAVANSGQAESASGLSFKPVVTPQGWTQGNPAAKIVLVEFGDYQCGACAAARQTVANVMKRHANELMLVFKQYPMEAIHRNSMFAAQAAEAAGKQFKFWEMHELLFLHQRDWADVPDPQTFFLKYAAELNLDLERFRLDLWDGAIREKIYRDILEGQLASVKSVPTFYLNGTLMPRAQSETQFEDIIVEAIKKQK
jgi:protein-disulfide isomerase